MDPLKGEAPEGMLVTGYPWYDLTAPAHRHFVERLMARTHAEPRLGSLVGYVTFLSIAEALRRAGPDPDTDRISAAFRGLTVETPIGPIMFRAADGQSTMGAWAGLTRLDRTRGVGVMVDYEYVPGEKVLPPAEEILKMRAGR